MRRFLAAAFLFAVSLPAAEHARIPRPEIANLEKIVNTQLGGMFPEEPWLLLGYTRGIYIEGVGVVFSADVNLATGPTVSPFSPNPGKEVLAGHHDKKLKRLPKLRETMYSIVRNMSTFLPALPPDEQVVFAVTLLRYPWETGNDIPSQIVMQVSRGRLLEAVAKNTALSSVVRAEEY